MLSSGLRFTAVPGRTRIGVTFVVDILTNLSFLLKITLCNKKIFNGESELGSINKLIEIISGIVLGGGLLSCWLGSAV